MNMFIKQISAGECVRLQRRQKALCIVKKRRILLWLLIPLLLLGACIWYLGTFYRADEAAIASFSTAFPVEEHRLENGDLTFGTGDESVGLIFYPGGRVEHRAYVPLMRELASNGVFCILCEMPFRLAVLNPDAADGLRETSPEVRHWFIGGHSLGGVMAASYLADHPTEFEGLILLGSYADCDLSDSGLQVLSVFGSEDGVLDRRKYEAARSFLPPDSKEVVIRGGCHAYFGMYGAQSGDGQATISCEAQIRQTAAAILGWLRAEDLLPSVPAA